MADTVYRSQVDQWLLVVFAVSALGAVAACGSLLYYGSHLEWLMAAASLLVGIGLPLWVLQSTTYTLTTGFLVVRSGPFHWSVPLRQVTRITPREIRCRVPRCPRPAPHRVLDGKVIMISPEIAGASSPNSRSRSRGRLRDASRTHRTGLAPAQRSSSLRSVRQPSPAP